MMPTADQVKGKAQRILAEKLGSAEVDRDGNLLFRLGSSVVFIQVSDLSNGRVAIKIVCPMVKDVPMSPALCRWIAVEGQEYRFGGCYLNPNADGSTAWVYFRHSILGDDLDESELMTSVGAVAATADQLDNELQAKFGGTLFGKE
jgi:hypothetical protein